MPSPEEFLTIPQKIGTCIKTHPPSFLWLTPLLAAFLLVPGAFAQSKSSTLLVVNVADPAAVTVTATGGAAIASDPNQSFLGGFDLLKFFTDVPNEDLPIDTSTLTTFQNGTPFFTNATTDSLSGSPVDLNFYNNDEDNSPETFTAGTQASKGTCTLDFSAVTSLLPGVGTVGEIYSGYNGNGEVPESFTNSLENQVLIGYYVVVPEAGARAWLLGGRGGVAGGAVVASPGGLRQRLTRVRGRARIRARWCPRFA